VAVLIQEWMQGWGGMSRSIVQHDKPKTVRIAVQQLLQMSLEFLMAFVLMNGVKTFPTGIDH
jgi:hypothetical protein